MCVAVLKNPSCQIGPKYSNYKDRWEKSRLSLTKSEHQMITKLTAGLLAITLLAACETTTTTAKRTTLREMNASRVASTDTTDAAPPAEGPEEAIGEAPNDPARNPALVPSPLLRSNAAGGP